MCTSSGQTHLLLCFLKTPPTFYHVFSNSSSSLNVPSDLSNSKTLKPTSKDPQILINATTLAFFPTGTIQVFFKHVSRISPASEAWIRRSLASAIRKLTPLRHLRLTHQHTALGSTFPVFIMQSSQKGAGAVSAVCLAAAQSSHMFSDMWEFELAQGGRRRSMQLISLSLHTHPAVLSMQMRGGRERERRGLSWVCSLSAPLLFHFKWINDKSRPLFPIQLETLLPHSSFSFTTFQPTARSWFAATFRSPSGCSLCQNIRNNTTDYAQYSRKNLHL